MLANFILAILICNGSGQCSALTAPIVFKSEVDCVQFLEDYPPEENIRLNPGFNIVESKCFQFDAAS